MRWFSVLCQSAVILSLMSCASDSKEFDAMQDVTQNLKTGTKPWYLTSRSVIKSFVVPGGVVIYEKTPWQADGPLLPASCQVWRKSFVGETLQSMELVYKLYDFDHDGDVETAERWDMIKGVPTKRAYDFDQDGIVDRVVRL